MNDPEISLGEGYAIQILVGRDLNLNPAFIPEAENYLKGIKLEPTLTIAFIHEAERMVRLVNQKKLLKRADILIDKYWPK